MCKECRKHICPSACPQFEHFLAGKGRAKSYCSLCGGAIYHGEEYYRRRDIVVCSDCEGCITVDDIRSLLVTDEALLSCGFEKVCWEVSHDRKSDKKKRTDLQGTDLSNEKIPFGVFGFPKYLGKQFKWCQSFRKSDKRGSIWRRSIPKKRFSRRGKSENVRNQKVRHLPARQWRKVVFISAIYPRRNRRKLCRKDAHIPKTELPTPTNGSSDGVQRKGKARKRQKRMYRMT